MEQLNIKIKEIFLLKTILFPLKGEAQRLFVKNPLAERQWNSAL